jgi:hypothetical protein
MDDRKANYSGNIIKPRFEFRTFGRNFENEIAKMKELSAQSTEGDSVRDSNEIYIVSKKNDIYNTKIRDNQFDIKFLVRTLNRFEQWKPILKAEFPISSSLVINEINPIFKIKFIEKSIEGFTREEFLKLIARQPELIVVEVTKKRFAFTVNQSICEWAFVAISGVDLYTISAESEDVDDLNATVKSIGLDQFENINYLQGIKRTTGLLNKPLAN